MKIPYLLSTLLLFIYSNSALAAVELKNPNRLPAKNCTNLICVRHHIDAIDLAMVKLIGLRLSYVKKAGELKKGKRAIHDQVRENKIIANVTQWAEKAGYPSAIAANVYQTLLIQTNSYEQQIQNHSSL